MSEQPLSVGRIVHVRVHGECRPAMVVRAWSPTVANLHVYLDGSNDDGEPRPFSNLVPGAIDWATSVAPATEQNPDGWHWPERVEAWASTPAPTQHTEPAVGGTEG